MQIATLPRPAIFQMPSAAMQARPACITPTPTVSQNMESWLDSVRCRAWIAGSR